MTETTQRYRQARKVTLVGAASNLFLAIIKVVFGWLGSSHALVADGIHSFSDLLTDLLVLVASRFGSHKADREHPYGHQRIETASTLFLAILLIVAGLGIGWDAAYHLVFRTVEHPKFYVLTIAIISIFSNEFLYHYTLRTGKRIGSQLLVANAWHHRSDAASSIVVFIGILGALMGYAYLDTLAALIVGIMIIRMGGKLGWSSVRELVDTGVPNEELDQISLVIKSVPGVLALHQLRTRCMGDNILIDAHILVQPKLSVSEGHYIAATVHQTLSEKIGKAGQVSDVTIHIDPEDDEIAEPSVDLPPRQQVLSELMAYWIACPGVDYIYETTLHYLDGKIQVVLLMSLMVLDDGIAVAELQGRYQEAVEALRYIGSVDIQFF